MRNLDHIAVVGVTGYTGFELARILVRHPGEKLPRTICADTNGRSAWRTLSATLRARRRSAATSFG